MVYLKHVPFVNVFLLNGPKKAETMLTVITSPKELLTVDFNPFSAGTVCIPQILTWKVPAMKELKYLLWPYTHDIGIQMKQKDLTKTFILFSD